MKQELQKEIEKWCPKLEKMFQDNVLEEFCAAGPRQIRKFNYGIGTMIRLRLFRRDTVLYKNYVRPGHIGISELTEAVMRRFHKYLRDRRVH